MEEIADYYFAQVPKVKIFFNSKKQEILIGAGGGLLFYHPYKAHTQQLFPLVFTQMLVDNKMIEIGNNKPYANLWLPTVAKSITIKFAGLYYGAPENIKYEYMLAGYDKQWQNAVSNYEATYQNLPAGDYTFSVRVLSNDNKVITTLTGLSFNIPPRFWQSWWFVALLFILIVAIVYWVIHTLLQKLKEEEQLNVFATSLYGQATIDDIYWDTAHNCIAQLGFSDCVIYEKDDNRNVLLQKAAAGPKKPGDKRQILNRLEIPVDRGIVGFVCRTGKSVVTGNTSKDNRYIIDDEQRFSEIAVPVFVENKVFAVIDSEHRNKNFFTNRQLRLLKKIAAICAERISKYLSEERLRTIIF